MAVTAESSGEGFLMEKSASLSKKKKEVLGKIKGNSVL